MGVPLGHKNHKSRRTRETVKPFKFDKKYFTRKYIIIDNSYVLTSDKKTLVCVNPETEGMLIVPEGIQKIDADELRYSNVRVLVIPNSVEEINSHCLPSGIEELIFKGPIPICVEPHTFCSLREIIVRQEEDIEKVKTICNSHSYEVRCKKEKWTRFRTTLYYVDLEKATKDEHGVLYSADRKILLKCNPELTTYEIPEGVDTISERAFYESMINNITLPKSMRVIGEKAFEDCHSLESITFNRGIKLIFDNAFKSCDKLQNISLPGSLMRMCSFKDCKSLESVILSKKLKEIPNGAFLGTLLSKMSLSQSIEKIGERAFCSSKIKQVKLPNHLKEISSYAFAYCTELKTIRIPKTVNKIPNFLFNDCTQLKKVIVEGNVDSVGISAFRNCTKLDVISLQKCEIIEKEAFYGCISLKNITLPDGLKIIGQGAFDGCVKLKSLLLPEGVVKIEYGFISNTSIKSIDIPASVEFMDRAFHGAKKLEIVRFLGNKAFGRSALPGYWKPQNDDDVFESCPNIKEIHIPYGTYDIYKQKYPSYANLFIEDSI